MKTVGLLLAELAVSFYWYMFWVCACASELALTQ